MLTHPMLVAATIALTSLLSLATGAAAATVTTPPILIPSGYVLWCALTNVGSRPLENLAVERVRLDGTVSSTTTTASLAPGATAASGGTVASTFGHCRVEGVSRRKVNLTACVQAASGSPCASITTSD